MRTVVAVLRGGPSSEYDISLKSGAHVLEHLNKEKYEPRDLFISKEGQWHLHGAPVSPERALRGADVAFNALHGQYGEDGQVQRLLDALGIPYTGSNAPSSASAFDKQATREVVKALGVKIAHGTVLNSNKITDLDKTVFNVFRSLPLPVIVKPTASGSSLGVTLADNFNALQGALQRAFALSPTVLVEEYIKGKEATVGVIEQFRGEKLYSLLPAEILLPRTSPFYDYQAKYGVGTQLRIPGGFSTETKRHLQQLAKKVHAGMGLRHYSQSDFIVSKRGIFFLEVNTHTDLGGDTEFSAMLHAVGANLSTFLDHVVDLARRRPNK